MPAHTIHWERADSSRIPFAVYTNEDSHRKELERCFYRQH